MKEEHIQNLISLKRSLENDIQGMEYTLGIRKTEVKFLAEFIKEHCNHKWVTDMIDIDPDRSMNISYCEKCESQFPR
jgi:hypothetical protein